MTCMLGYRAACEWVNQSMQLSKSVCRKTNNECETKPSVDFPNIYMFIKSNCLIQHTIYIYSNTRHYVNNIYKDKIQCN